MYFISILISNKLQQISNCRILNNNIYYSIVFYFSVLLFLNVIDILMIHIKSFSREKSHENYNLVISSLLSRINTMRIYYFNNL